MAGSAEIKGSHSFQFPWDGIAQKERLSQRCVSLMPQWANHVSGVVDSVPAAFISFVQVVIVRHTWRSPWPCEDFLMVSSDVAMTVTLNRRVTDAGKRSCIASYASKALRRPSLCCSFWLD